jgi:hypothetical protein
MTEGLHIVIRKIVHSEDDDVPYVEEHNVPFEKFIEMFMARVSNRAFSTWGDSEKPCPSDCRDELYQPTACCGGCDKS